MGFSEMTPIQAATIAPLLAGKDLIGQSQTGSGKTAAFLIPILVKIEITESAPQALVLCPTRELCDQVLLECRKFAKAFQGLKTVALVGGQPYPPQLQALQNGVHLAVGTPGRTLELLRSGQFSAKNLKCLVLDEADRMLDEGFADEMTAILEKLPRNRQTIFFSATFTENVEKLSRRFQKEAERITIDVETHGAPLIEQYVYAAEKDQKKETLVRILLTHPSMCTLIFCRMKSTVDELGRFLAQAKVRCEVLHGDLEQSERDRAITLFRNGSLRILVATDVAARGIDIDALELVINYDLPVSPEIYVHRIGRTGRAGRSGAAVSIATGFESSKIIDIETFAGVTIKRNHDLKAPANLGHEFQKTLMNTLQVFGGRNDKLRPGDILGALTAEPDAIPVAKIGKIQIFERVTFVAVSPEVAIRALEKLQKQKIKGSKFKTYLF